MEPFSCRPFSLPAHLRLFLLLLAVVAAGCGPGASVDRAEIRGPGVCRDRPCPPDGGADGALGPAQAAEAGAPGDAGRDAPTGVERDPGGSTQPDASLPVGGPGNGASDAAAAGPAPTVPDAAVDVAAPADLAGTTPEAGSTAQPLPDTGPPPPPTGPPPPVLVEVVAPPAPIALSTLGIRDWMHFG